jgi:hypothetical protein
MNNTCLKNRVFTNLLFVFGLMLLLFSCSPSEKTKPPKEVYKLTNHEEGLVQLPDGQFMLFKKMDENLVSMISSDGHSWTEPKTEVHNHSGVGVGLMLIDNNGELHNVRVVRRVVPNDTDDLKGPAITIMLDIWHSRTIDQRTKWEAPGKIFDGYCGALLDFKQLRSGRLIVPFAYWVAGQSPLPRGLNTSTVVYSDDGGKTWEISEAELTAPAFEGYPGNNYGAIEPAVVELEKDGYLFMLMRSQTGFLYKSYSTDNGTTWAPAVASRFYSFNGPPLLKELPDGRFFLVWNNCDAPPRYEGNPIYGGRDAIHAAISDDYGKTWKGFREIHRDPLRNETPPKSGDRGTSYSNSPNAVGNNIMLITGMGEGRRHIISVDTDWLTATHHESDFSNGLEEWTVFKHFGSVTNYWRDRVVGPQLVEHPTEKGKKVLHIRRPDEKDADGAVWNFPNGQSGRLTLRIMFNEGFRGGCIALTDRFFNPSDNSGEKLAMFCLSINNKGQFGQDAGISVGQWHTLEFVWNLTDRVCKVISDGKPVTTLPLNNETLNGLSYLRLRSMAQEKDTAGYFIESVVVDIDDNVVPWVNDKQTQEIEAGYRRFSEKNSTDGKPDESNFKKESGYLM